MQYTAVFTLLSYKYVFTASAVLLKFTVLCIGIFIGIFPETLYFLLASYRYFMENFDSVMFLRPCGSPDSGLNARICFLMKSLEFCPDGQLGRQVHKVRVVPLNHKAKSNAPLRDRGGVNPYGQPDHKISIFDNYLRMIFVFLAASCPTCSS